MRFRSFVVVAVGALLTVGTAAFAATEPDDIVDQIELRGYYIDANVDIDINDLERLVADVTDLYFVGLAEDPAGGADLFASDVLDQVQLEGTVIVVSPGELGARSTVFDDARLGDALDRSLDDFDRSYLDGFRDIASSLGRAPDVVVTTQAATGTAAASGGSGSGGSGGLIFLLVIAGVGALIFFMVRKGKRRQQEAFEGRIDEIKAEIRSQLGAVADDILELEDEVLFSDNEQAKDLYAAGSQSYADFEEQLDAATTLAQLDDLAEVLDRSQWQLEAAEALIDGKPMPPQPADRPDFEPPASPQQPRPPARSPRADLPPDLQMRRERGEPIDGGRAPQRRRSGGWLGGLGTAAVILKNLQQNRQTQSRRSRSGIQWPGGGRSSGGSGVNMPNLGSSGRSSRTTRSSSRSSSPSSASSGKSMKGRARRKR
jgi:hypothetical protein